MRKSFLTIAALVGARTLTINAQTPQTQPPPRPAPPAETQRRRSHGSGGVDD